MSSKYSNKISKEKEKKSKFKEFSKIVIIMFAIMWMTAGLFLLWVVHYQITHAGAPEYVSADVVCTYFMAPVTAGLISYFAKAAFENTNKIKGGTEKDMLSMRLDSSSIENDVPQYDVNSGYDINNFN